MVVAVIIIIITCVGLVKCTALVVIRAFTALAFASPPFLRPLLGVMTSPQRRKKAETTLNYHIF